MIQIETKHGWIHYIENQHVGFLDELKEEKFETLNITCNNGHLLAKSIFVVNDDLGLCALRNEYVDSKIVDHKKQID
jgi:hypothetical protein